MSVESCGDEASPRATLSPLYVNKVKTCMYSYALNHLSQTGGQSKPWLIASPEKQNLTTIDLTASSV
jgi:hypothetical protein